MSKINAVAVAERAAEAKKAQDVVTLDIRANSSFADYFLIATGLNKVHTRSVADFIEESLAKQGIVPYSKQGYRQGSWILIDYLDFVVHIFTQEARDFYQLERLWQQE